MEIVEETRGDDWKAAERHWIAMFRFWGFPLCNHNDGGDSGYKMAVETKLKIGARNKGRIRTPEMRKRMSDIKRASHTPELGEKIRALKLGLKHSPETRLKMSETRLGHLTSEETKRKISESHKGMKHTPETKEKLRAARYRQIAKLTETI